MLEVFKKQKSSLLLLFLVLLLLTTGLVLGWLIFFNQPKETACTTEAKICADGSAVGRTGPDCSFAPCPYEIFQSTDYSCVVDDDCVLPVDDSKRSGCQKAARCLSDNKCAIVCLAPSTNPSVTIEENWKTMVGLIEECQVRQITQTHDRRVTARLKNGYEFIALEPTIDEVFTVVRNIEEKCGKIIMATE